jgi:phosphate transport system protein
MNSIKTKYLDQLLDDFRLLSEIVLSQIVMMQELINSQDEINRDLFEDIERNENLIDGLDVKIKEEVINAIFLFTPRASDLRRIVACHDMTICLERIGDLILNVSRSLKEMNLNAKGFEEFRKMLAKMLKHAEKMMQNAVLAFTNSNSLVAYDTIATDNKVDALYRKISEKLPDSFTGKKLSHQELQNIMGINSISCNIERIADNATNIAESAVYLAEGRDIRHKSIDDF